MQILEKAFSSALERLKAKGSTGQHSPSDSKLIVALQATSNRAKYQARFAGTAEQVKRFIAASALQKNGEDDADDEWEWVSEQCVMNSAVIPVRFAGLATSNRRSLLARGSD